MSSKKVIGNIFSNWTNLFTIIVIAFFVSPVIVHKLGNENYGIWVLISSVIGYFTILDFGVNTAIVRFISKYVAKREYQKANEVYSTSFLFFLFVSTIILLVSVIFAFFFKSMFEIEILGKYYLFFILFVVGTDFALSMLFSVLQGTLVGLQEYVKINVISISAVILKNIAIVVLLIFGFKLLTLAFIQLFASLFRITFQYLVICRKYQFFKFRWSSYNRPMMKQIFNYSIYSFIISIALKLLFYTDSIVIGSLISAGVVVFYAIPATLVDYLHKFMWAMIGVLVPVISSHQALDELEKNRNLYFFGTKYSLALCLPFIFVLFTVGDDFIALWMGPEYGLRSAMVLNILLVGYMFSFSQLIAHAILKGISKHKVLSFVLIMEAIANLGMSIALARPYGIEGVAVGTALPMLIVNIFIIPMYTCRELQLNLKKYFFNAFLNPLLGLTIIVMLYQLFPVKVETYPQLMLYSLIVAGLFVFITFVLVLERNHRLWVLKKLVFIRKSGLLQIR